MSDSKQANRGGEGERDRSVDAPAGTLADALPEEEDEPTGVVRITQVHPVEAHLQPRDRATLTTLSGPETGRVYSIQRDPILGRGDRCAIRLDDNSVSRTHARISARGALRWVLEDLDSRNGTFVNGVRVTSHPLKDGDNIQLGASVRLRFAVSNVEEESVLRRLYESSVRDGLTGAYNRKHFNDRLESEVSYSIRHGTDLALLIYDIDHFKLVNDRFGHLAGDRVLSKLTSVLQHTVRTEDLLARYGGEEFAVLARGIPLDGALSLGERIRGIAQQLVVRFEGLDLRITVSIGVATLADVPDERSAQALIRRADGCLYEAKRLGRNRVMGPR